MLLFPFLSFPDDRELSAGWNLAAIIVRVSNKR